MNQIPLPRMSEFLLEDFMLPMNLSIYDVSNGTGIAINDLQAIFMLVKALENYSMLDKDFLDKNLFVT